MSNLQMECTVLKLLSWPDLPQLAPDKFADVARVCALLAYRPTAGGLLPRMLGISPARAQEILGLLESQGCLKCRDGEAADDAIADQAPVAQDSFLAKIWHRLSHRH